jgi:cation diffusion facilitator CzcD-associated flavoprotein CzcO
MGDPLPNDHKNVHTPPLFGENGLEFESPLYDYLETNIPKQLMAYSDQPFDNDLPLFPSHDAVLAYLELYADEISHLVHFHTQVVKVTLAGTCPSDLWEVTTRKLSTGQTLTSTYDAVVVANGHYTIPYVPDIIGLHSWNEENPGIIIHSKAYRRPEDFTDKKVIVVGNSASGTDIAAQIARYCKQPLLLSSRTSNELFPRDSGSQVEDVPEIIEFLSSEMGERAVIFRDGRVESAIDAVIFATGYFYHFPFLDLASPVITDGFRAHDVYQHVFHIEHPSLAFPVLNLKIIPFPLAENQAAVIARVWAGRLSLPEKKEMRTWEGRRLAERGAGKAFHVLKFPEDAEVLNRFFEWARAARRVKGMENDGLGKLGVHWDVKSVWMRARLPAIKKAFAERQDERFVIRRAEELGFDYEKCNRL